MHQGENRKDVICKWWSLVVIIAIIIHIIICFHPQDYLKLGPLELKLLSISGQHMKVHKRASPSLDTVQSQEFKPDKWPVTGAMLHSTLKGNSVK